MYGEFARIYDKLQSINYEKYVEYIESIFRKFDKKPELVLDLACGSGTLTCMMAEKGYDMIGLDLSPEMLDIANEKAKEKELDILFINQDMCDFELYGTVDAVICSLDGVNYVTDPEDLKKVFALVKNYLNPDGIMIFDINSEYKLRRILGENTFVEDEEGVFYVWQNEFDEEEKICTFILDIFEEDKDGKYSRFEEYQEERAYSTAELEEIITESGLPKPAFYKEFSFDNPDVETERIFGVIVRG